MTDWRSTDEQQSRDVCEREMRVRDAAYRLLQLCTHKQQKLEAAKNILTASTRIHTHRTYRPQTPDQPAVCKGRVAISGLRIPLMWRDSDHFNNRGSSRSVAVFSLMILGHRVLDSELQVVDRSITDICFSGQSVFEDVESNFHLRLELYSCSMEEAPPLSATPRKLANKLRSSLGKAAGRKLRPQIDSLQDDFLETHPLPPGVSFSLLAFTSLGLEQVGRDFLSHSLNVTQTAESSSWLPLYGSVCCRLLAQPDCVRIPAHSGTLCQQVCVEGVFRSCSLHCELQGATVRCWFSAEEVPAKLPPFLTLPIATDTCVRILRDQHGSVSMTISTPGSASSSHVFRGSAPDLQLWATALTQHTHDMSSWKQCCEELMQIEVLSPRKPTLFHAKQPETVYSELSINSPGKFESVTDIIHNKIEETGGRFLIGQEEQLEAPNWSALFGGSRPLVVQKVVMSPGAEPHQSCFSPVTQGNNSPVARGNKKRKAPPPPYAPPTPTATSRPSNQEKRRVLTPQENLSTDPSSNQEQGKVLKAGPRAGRRSLDSKFSSVIQQLQRKAPANHNAPQTTAAANRNPPLSLQQPPVPAPRHKLRKSFRQIMNPKAF
ncbi:rhotekin-2 isoform X2 [Sardina pilchardus]|uniref:rhotekin-2 isoform X2 n=1 Tax=Sardina pilchardus TaxID=27697 RepID=UPI002E0E2D7A